jgi:hypothetical protein
VTRDDIWGYCLQRHYSAAYAGYWMDHRVCEACQRKPSEPPHHVRTRGANGVDDSPENLLGLCLEDHAMIHAMGRQVFVKRYPHLKRKIDSAFDRPKVR